MASFLASQIRLAVVLLLQLSLTNRVVADPAVGLPAGCPTSCGNITIPYPFGIKPGCYHNGFKLNCNQSYHPPRLFIGDDEKIQVLEILLQEGILRARSNILTVSLQEKRNSTVWPFDWPSVFSLSMRNNVLVAFGCGILAQAFNLHNPRNTLAACVSLCGFDDALPVRGTCSGVLCCQASLPFVNGSFVLQIMPISQSVGDFADAKRNSALLVELEWFNRNVGVLWKFLNPMLTSNPPSGVRSLAIPFVLDWTLGDERCAHVKNNKSSFGCRSKNSACQDVNDMFDDGYRCSCSEGFEGNPYIDGGCQDINECYHPDSYPCRGICINEQGTYKCYNGTVETDRRNISGLTITIGVCTGFGLLALLLGGFMLIRKFKKRRSRKLKQKFFKKNHGLLLQQLISSNRSIAERMRIFSLEELEKATNKFEQNRIVGRGGHGIVYKGILSDQRVVAVKRSFAMIQREIDQFINEVVILSQIHHRNVVKLYGCCLESEVPLLVYEFISNGTLFNHMHISGNLSWENRFRIALETARALAHLHSAASISVFHRDIKSANILLDDYLTAKVSDFGASRSIQMDQSRVTTAIQGTYGYLDPEYYYTGRLTEKSDVYSFGVILAELITREKPTSASRYEEGENLASFFCVAVRENRLNDILDPMITTEVHISQIEAVAALAEMSLRLKGEERPTIKEVEMRLEALHGPKKRQHQSGATIADETQSLPNNRSGGVEATRQYSLENELILSSHFAR